MKIKIGGASIVWVFAVIMAVISFTLPPSSRVKEAKEQKETTGGAQKEYVLYLPNGQNFQTEKVSLEENTGKQEEIRAVVQADLDALYKAETENRKIDLWNIYQDGNIIYLTFSFIPSQKSQAAIKKTIAELGVEQEVRILTNGK